MCIARCTSRLQQKKSSMSALNLLIKELFPVLLNKQQQNLSWNDFVSCEGRRRRDHGQWENSKMGENFAILLANSQIHLHMSILQHKPNEFSEWANEEEVQNEN